MDRYDKSLWSCALDLSGKTLKKDSVGQLLDRGVSVLRLAKAEVR